MRLCIDYFVYVLIRLTAALVQAAPIETCRQLARPLIWLAADVFRIRADVIDDNLSHAFPKMSPAARRRLARRHWEHLFLLAIEVVHVQRKIHLSNWWRHIRFRGKREIVRRLMDERPVVIVSGHHGNFELAGYAIGLLGFESFTVARPLDNQFLDRYMNRFRRSHGQLILPKTGSAKAGAQLLSHGGTLAVLGDQAAGPKGCWVDFFGRPASTHKAIALFALTHEAPLMVICGVRRNRPLQFDIEVEGCADPQQDERICRGVRELTAWYTNRLEDAVRRRPEQYWWVHRRWKNYRPRKRRKAPRAEAA